MLLVAFLCEFCYSVNSLMTFYYSVGEKKILVKFLGDILL